MAQGAAQGRRGLRGLRECAGSAPTVFLIFFLEKITGKRESDAVTAQGI